MKKRIDLIVLCILLAIGGLLSLYLGPATGEFDTRNYHIYAPYAFLTDRLGYDVLPAGIRSYFNPILDIPYYLMFKYFNHLPKLVSFIQGFYFGGIVFCGYKLATLFKIGSKKLKIWFIIISTLVNLITPIAVIECGGLYNDLQVGILICLSLYLYLKVILDKDCTHKNLRTIIAGASLGAAFGLKLTCAVMVFGVFCAVLSLIEYIENPKKMFFTSVLSALGGFFVINGYWYYKVWEVFKNPIFPYANNIFKSPYGLDALIANDSYTRVLPKTLDEKLFYPFFPFLQLYRFDLSGFGSWLFRYVDLRVPLCALCVMYYSMKFSVKKEFNHDEKILIAFIAFILTTYIVWLNIFPIARYIIPMFIIAGIIVSYAFAKLAESFENSIIITSFIFITFVCLLFHTSYHFGTKLNYGRQQGFSKYLYEPIHYKIPDNSLVLLGMQTTGYTIPQLNPKARYFYLIYPKSVDVEKYGINSYNTRTIDYYYSEYYENELKKIIPEYKNIYLLYVGEGIALQSALKYYIPNYKYEDCRWIDKYTAVCKIKK